LVEIAGEPPALRKFARLGLGVFSLGEPSDSLRQIDTRRSYYGWVIVVVAAMAMVATMPGRTHGLGMITERLLQDSAFEMSRVEYSNMNLWGTLLGGLFCLPCGWLIDRFGLRSVLTVIVAVLGAVVLWMTHLTGNAALFVAITLTRGFGQSALSVLSITMVGKWFGKGVTLPMAVYSLILSLGFGGAFQLAKPYANSDWRTLWGAIGWLLLGVMLPVAVLLTRDPKRNAPASYATNELAATETEIGFTLRQAMRTPAFWMFGMAISHMAVISGLSLFNEAILKSQGFESKAFYDMMSMSSIAGLVAQLPVGWLGRRVSLARMQMVGLAIQATCMMGLPFVRTMPQLGLYCAGMGVGGAISAILFYSVWSQAFGRRHLGHIQGFSQMLTVLASALGPKFLAECQARTGGYHLAFQLLSVVGFCLAAGFCFVRVPKPEEALTSTGSSS